MSDKQKFLTDLHAFAIIEAFELVALFPGRPPLIRTKRGMFCPMCGLVQYAGEYEATNLDTQLFSRVLKLSHEDVLAIKAASDGKTDDGLRKDILEAVGIL